MIRGGKISKRKSTSLVQVLYIFLFEICLLCLMKISVYINVDLENVNIFN